jgi:hypothetical protein
MLDPIRWAAVQDTPLLKGAHTPDSQYCVLELVAYVAVEKWSDHPRCVSPAIGDLLRTWNDALDDDTRQLLKPLIPLVIGTRTTAADETRRAWLATDWLVRIFAPAWLDLAGLAADAAALRALPDLTTDELATAALPVIEGVRQRANAAYSAARSAAGSAAGSAAYSAAGSAAGSAAYSAAGSAAYSAAGSAARSAAWSAARSAAESAARSAAESALAPTVHALQSSAVTLVLTMCRVRGGTA